MKQYSPEHFSTLGCFREFIVFSSTGSGSREFETTRSICLLFIELLRGLRFKKKSYLSAISSALGRVFFIERASCRVLFTWPYLN